MLEEKYKLVCNTKDNKLVCTLKKWENGKLIFQKNFEVKNADWNRLMIDGNLPIICKKVDEELHCTVNASGLWIPLICDRNNKCGLEANLDDVILVLYDLKKAEEKKPGFSEFLARHGIKIKIEPEEKGPLGYYMPFLKGIVYNPFGPHPVETLLHEWAHCREDIAREEKGLSKAKGEWKQVEKGLIPVGHEKRAVQFVERIKRTKK